MVFVPILVYAFGRLKIGFIRSKLFNYFNYWFGEVAAVGKSAFNTFAEKKEGTFFLKNNSCQRKKPRLGGLVNKRYNYDGIRLL